MGAFSFTSYYSIFLLNFLVFSNAWLMVAAVNVDVIINGINVLTNVNAVAILVLMRQMYRFQEKWMKDKEQAR